MGSNNRLKVRRKVVNVRVRILFLMTFRKIGKVEFRATLIMPPGRIRCKIRGAFFLTRKAQNPVP